MTGRPPFIGSQRMRILRPVQNPRAYLSAHYFRSQRHARRQQALVPGSEHDQQNPWVPVSRNAIVSGQARIDGLITMPLERVVLASDAGMGKSTALDCLLYGFNRPGSRTLAFKIDVADLPQDPTELLPSRLLRAFRLALGASRTPLSPAVLQRLLERLRQQGRLVLLLDALDQVPTGGRQILDTLNHVLHGAEWARCRIILSSRPYAVDQYWNQLFERHAGWQFIQLDDFDGAQQQQFLGAERYHAVPPEARVVLTVPRVLDYVRNEVDVKDLSRIRTPSDVFSFATGRMLVGGLTEGGKRLDASEARFLLSAIAIEMTAVGKFDSIPPGEMALFLGKLAARCERYHRQFGIPATDPYSWFSWCRNKLAELAAMDSHILDYGLLEAGRPQQLQWPDQLMQAFFAALWLSKYAVPGDSHDLGQGLYLAHDPQTFDYYWVWRLAAEMPPEHRATKPWIASMKPLYASGDGTAFGTRRSTEMIYRSWNTVQRAGSVGADGADELTREFQQQLLQSYQAEVPDEIQGGRRNHADSPADEQPSHILGEFLALRTESADIPTGFRRVPPDDAIRVPAPVPETFLLACSPTTNEQFELFDPSHCLRAGLDRQSGKLVGRAKDDARCPVVLVSWYDAWAFCLWLGAQFRLPSEGEWEFACRAGTKTSWSFGDDPSALDDHAWTNQNSGGRLHTAGALHANPWLLFDMHGHVFEWCDSWYDQHSGGAGTLDLEAMYRVCRGGAWAAAPRFSRSAERYAWWPSPRDDIGFRVAASLKDETQGTFGKRRFSETSGPDSPHGRR